MGERVNQPMLASLLLACVFTITLDAQTLSEASIKALFGDQPDYQANYTVTLGNETSKFGLAKKGSRFRHEIMPVQNASQAINEEYRFYRIVTLTTPGRQVVAWDPQEHIYTEIPEDIDQIPTPDLLFYFEAAIKHAGKVSAIELGSQLIDGHKVRRIRVSFGSDDTEQAVIYVATDLKDLIVKIDGADVNGKLGFSMSEFSLEVPDELFEVPSTYKKVGFEDFISAMKRKVLRVK